MDKKSKGMMDLARQKGMCALIDKYCNKKLAGRAKSQLRRIQKNMKDGGLCVAVEAGKG
jgi:hypothetical protein